MTRVCRKRDKNDSFSSIANHRPHRNQRRQQSKEKIHAKRQPVVIRMYCSYYTNPCVDLERKLAGNLLLVQYLVCAVMDCSFKCSIALFALQSCFFFMLIKWESFSHLLLDDKNENQGTKVHLAVILTISLEIREWIRFFFLIPHEYLFTYIFHHFNFKCL